MSSSTANSSSTRSPWPYQRQRTPSRATTASTSTSIITSSTSPVTAEAAGSVTSIEQKVQNRSTLSRHLSQSSSSRPDGAKQQQRRASSSTPVAAKESPETTITPSTSASSSLNNSPVTSPTVLRRKSSIPVPSSGVKRSPSWMNSVARKSSLNVPQLSTIEGSVADLSSSPSTGSTSPTGEASEVKLAETPLIEETEPVLAEEHDKADQSTMKRQRSQQDTGRAEGDAFKRQSTASEVIKDDTDDTAKLSEVKGLAASGQSENITGPEIGGLLPVGVIAELPTPSTSASGTSGWMGYLTMPKSSKLPKAAASVKSKAPKEPEPALSTQDKTEEASKASSEEAVMQQPDSSARFMKEHPCEQPSNVLPFTVGDGEEHLMAPTSSRRSYFDIRLFAAADKPKETASAGKKEDADIPQTKVTTPIPVTSETAVQANPADQMHAEQDSAAPNSSVDAASEGIDNKIVETPQASTLRPRKVAPPPTERPTSWWPWTVASDTPSGPASSAELDIPVIAQTTLAYAEQHIPPKPTEPEEPSLATGETTAGPENIATSELPPSEAGGSVPPVPDSATPGWGSWLGSYLAQPRPVAITTITYGTGIAPSDAGTSASSIASTIAPEADETLPLPPIITEDEPVATIAVLQPVNPLLVTVPASNWSSFFTGSRIYAPKLVDSRSAAERAAPESMEIDFSEMESGSTVERRPLPASPAQSSSTLKPGSRSGRGIVEKTISRASSIASISMLKSASTGTISALSSATTRTSSSSMQPSSSAQPSTSASPATSGVNADDKPVKPVTTDKKTSKGTTMSKSKSSESQTPKKPPRPNLVLPSFEDTFHAPPRSLPPPAREASPPVQSTSSGGLKKAVAASLGYFFADPAPTPVEESRDERKPSLKGKERAILSEKVERLPRAYSVLDEKVDLSKSGTVVVIGIHGWFMQSYLKNVVGEPTGTSTKFASMMKSAVKAYFAEHGEGLNDEAITTIPLEGEGVVKDRLARLYQNLMARQDWVSALNSADKIFIASHSQGTIVSAMLVSKLINEGEINGTKVAMLNMCSVSQGPFVSLYNSWTVPAYLYFESAAASELFEFQKPESAPSQQYLDCMRHILNAGVKILFIASLNDQVVPLYSALFSSLSHPNLLRAIFIDSQAFETSADFMTNLVVFATRLRNAGLTPHGLDFHLSEALAGSLMGVGHSAIYDEPQVYKYATRYLLETSGPIPPPPMRDEESTPLIELEPFNPRVPANSYFLPWALRGIIEDPQIRTLFSAELQQLRDEFEKWDPKTKALQQVKNALEPLRFLPRSTLANNSDVPESSETGKDPHKKAVAKL